MSKSENDKKLITRSPIIAVMGHVDHGKSSLLDFIRKTNVVAKEAGGITQSIGAYEISHNNKRITFIDTPGHEAFSKMRARGAKVADLAILVVAADDGVKPQTKEVIDILKEIQTPFVVAVSKIDKPGADVEKVKQELMQVEVLLEGYGGNISWQAISSKSGQGIDELLDLILLAAEMEELTYNPEVEASGIIIESKIDSRRGVTATTIIKNGTLKIGDEIFTQSVKGRIKILENFLGEKVAQLTPSSPALILGFETLPQIGEQFSVSEILAQEDKLIQKPKPKITEAESELPTIKLILMADVSGSLEALFEVIKNLPTDEIKIEIINKSIGDITDGNVKLAQSTKSVIIGFKVRVDKAAENLARSQEIKIITSEVIYELVKSIEEEIAGLGLPKITGDLEILATFSKKGKKQLIGGKVVSGIIKNKSKLEIKRGEEIIGQGKILNLQHQKQDVVQVEEGKECGVMFESDIIIEKGDHLIYYVSSS
ncbi:MAG: translation initiation factor IF-2 [Candidatus Paceibacterota bacterium]